MPTRTAIIVIVAILSASVAGRVSYTWLITENWTNSLPLGLYIRAFREPTQGVLLWFPMPDAIAGYIRKYYPAEYEWFRQPANGFLKPIVGVAGDTMCRDKREVFSVNGKPLGIALTRDLRGHPLPSWRGCRRITAGNVAVFSDHDTGSIDSRYFGLVRIPDNAATYRPFITWGTRK